MEREARRRNIRFVAYNTRFLIRPWIKVPHLASHILARITGALPGDCERVYSHPVYFAETFNLERPGAPGGCGREWLSDNEQNELNGGSAETLPVNLDFHAGEAIAASGLEWG